MLLKLLLNHINNSIPDIYLGGTGRKANGIFFGGLKLREGKKAVSANHKMDFTSTTEKFRY